MMISMGKTNKYIKHKNIEEDECLICFDKFKRCSCKIVCCICSNKCHYSCYQKFIKINTYYANKCLQCNTKTVYKRKPWWLCCYF